MKKLFISLLLLTGFTINNFAAKGDSIFDLAQVHNIYITFPYSTFYDSLIATNTNDRYLMVTVQFNNEHYDSIGIKVKGNSSFNNPSQKKSFKLDFNTFVAGKDIHGLKKLNFNNSFKDPSFMREKLATDFIISHGAPSPRITYCNVYFNNTLWGLYTIVESIDDEFCNRWFGSNDGNLFQGDPKGDLAWKGASTQSLYTSSYDLENNALTNDWSDLIQLINVANNEPISTLQSKLDTLFNTEMFYKHWVCQNMFVSLDSYIGSGHNYYIYHDTITNKFQWISWDMNETFGNFKNNLTTSQLKNLDIYYMGGTTTRPLTYRMLQVANYKQKYNDSYCELKQDFNNAYFDPKIDSLYNMIKPHVYADTKKFYTNTDFENNINNDVTLTGGQTMTVFGLKSFIQARSASIASSILSNNVICTTGIERNTSLPVTFYPNPTNSLLNIKHNDASPLPYVIYSITGKVAKEGFIESSGIINVKDLANGIYALKINNSSYRFIKE